MEYSHLYKYPTRVLLEPRWGHPQLARDHGIADTFPAYLVKRILSSTKLAYIQCMVNKLKPLTRLGTRRLSSLYPLSAPRWATKIEWFRRWKRKRSLSMCWANQHTSYIPLRGWREHDFTERQDIWTGPVQEKSSWPGSGTCLAETVRSRSRIRFPGPVKNNWRGPGTGVT